MSRTPSSHVTIIKDAPENYQDEYTVKINRLTEHLGPASTPRTKLGSAIDIVGVGQSVQQHRHPVVEMTYLVNGTARIVVEDEEHVVSAGDVTIMRENRSHEVFNACDETIRIFSVWWANPDSDEPA